MKHIFLILTIFAMTAVPGAAEPEGEGATAALRRNLYEALVEDFAPEASLHKEFVALSENGFANDAVMNQLYLQTVLSAEECRTLEDTFRQDSGQWSDINYAHANPGCWEPALHISRLCALAKTWQTPGHPFWHDKGMEAIIHRGAKWWIDNDPRNRNWWWNEIGIPRKAAFYLLLMGDAVTPEERAGFLKITGRSCTEPRLTGQNLVWEAGVLLMKAALEDDAAAVETMKNIIEGTVQVTEKEGLQSDGSFHLHGHMLQFGNYGLAFFDSIAFWIRVLEGTPWAFSDKAKETLAFFGESGLGWCFYQGYMDPSMRGRHLFPGSGRGKDVAYGIARENLERAGIHLKGSFTGGRNLGGPVGGRYFPKSDVGIFRTKRSYTSIRMHSARTLGYEMTNGENLGGFYSADGALLTMVRGDEYDDIFPCWDWHRLPGTTVRDLGGPTPIGDPRKYPNKTAHVGGVATAKVLAATMQLCRDSLNAFKSAFIFEDRTVNLGCGIRAAGRGDVTTGIEQNYLQDNYFHKDNVAFNGSTGYLVLDGDFRVSAGPQSGRWTLLDPAASDSLVTRNIFKMWILHDKDKVRSPEGDSYAYVVFPGRKPSRNPGVEVLSNTSACQAVRRGNIVAVVFHKPGSLKVGRTTLSAGSPCIIVKTPDGITTESLPEAL